MKIKILAGLLVVGSLSSFSNYEETPVKYNKDKSKVAVESSEGEQIMAKQDCATCHKVDKKVIGPSYVDIAKKYPLNDKNINYLSDKIIKGGSGVWGAIPMGPHNTLKKEDAKKIVKYILSLNK